MRRASPWLFFDCATPDNNWKMCGTCYGLFTHRFCQRGEKSEKETGGRRELLLLFFTKGLLQ